MSGRQEAWHREQKIEGQKRGSKGQRQGVPGGGAGPCSYLGAMEGSRAGHTFGENHTEHFLDLGHPKVLRDRDIVKSLWVASGSHGNVLKSQSGTTVFRGFAPWWPGDSPFSSLCFFQLPFPKAPTQFL